MDILFSLSISPLSLFRCRGKMPACQSAELDVFKMRRRIFNSICLSCRRPLMIAFLDKAWIIGVYLARDQSSLNISKEYE